MGHLDVHQRIHLAREGRSIGRFVRCPDDGRWAPLEACRRCPRAVAVHEAAVSCATEPDPRPARPPEAAPITEVLDGSIVCIDGDVCVESAAVTLEEHDAPLGVIVDATHHPIGVCSPHDLRRAPPGERVDACMTPALVMMLDGATVADAIDLVVARGLAHVPVLAAGRVIGLVTPRAIIRWLARGLRSACTARAPAKGRP